MNRLFLAQADLSPLQICVIFLRKILQKFVSLKLVLTKREKQNKTKQKNQYTLYSGHWIDEKYLPEQFQNPTQDLFGQPILAWFAFVSWAFPQKCQPRCQN